MKSVIRNTVKWKLVFSSDSSSWTSRKTEDYDEHIISGDWTVQEEDCESSRMFSLSLKLHNRPKRKPNKDLKFH